MVESEGNSLRDVESSFDFSDLSPIGHILIDSSGPGLNPDELQSLLEQRSERLIIPPSVHSGEKSIEEAKEERNNLRFTSIGLITDNDEVIREMLDKGVLPEVEMGELDDQGKITSIRVRMKEIVSESEDPYVPMTENDVQTLKQNINPEIASFLKAEELDHSDGSLLFHIDLTSEAAAD